MKDPAKNRVHFGEGLAAVVCLLAPAIWNGFPFLQYDSGGYLARWFEGYLVPSRSTVYGLFAVAGWPLDFWPVVALQAAAAVWMVAVALRVFGLRERRFALLGTIAVLSAITSLPWLSGILLTDIFAGTSVLALHFLLFTPNKLGKYERVALIGFVAFATASHSATFAVLAGIAVLAAAARLCFGFLERSSGKWKRFAVRKPDHAPVPGIGSGVAAIGLGVAMLLVTNFALSGVFGWTPGGYGIVFARMLQDGIVERYLEDHCPDPAIRLCPYRGHLPATADAFLWSDGPFNQLGRFEGLGDEMRRIALDSLKAYPVTQVKAAIQDTLEQLVLVESGEGVITPLWHTYGIIDRYMPAVAPAMRSARQQHGEISFRAINKVHVPIALLSMLLLPVVMVRFRKGEFADLGLLAGTVTASLLINAFVCGALSNPHSRYGARLAWIATFAVALVPMRAIATRQVQAAVATGAPPAA